MALPPPTYCPNPVLAYVWIRINGVDITIPTQGPRKLTGFSYSRIGDKGGNRATISFFDENWDEVENPIVSSSTFPEITFRYGYTDGLQSPDFTGLIYDYKPVFAIDGTKIVVEVISVGFQDGADRLKSRTWKGMDIHEIVAAIAREHSWNSEIDETRSILDNDGIESSLVEKKVFHQSNVRDLQFIITCLTPFAVRKTDKTADYKVWLDDRTNTLHFHPPRFEESEVATFVFMRDRMSEVISFSPDMRGQLNLRLGAGVAGTPYLDSQTGQYGTVVHTNATTPEKTLLGGPLTAAGKEIDEDFSVSDGRYVRDAFHADTASRDRFFDQFNSIFGATMVLQGNPTLLPHTVIRMIVIKRDGNLHYSSGLYKILDILDQIDPGNFTSTLNMIRNSYPAAGVGGDQGIGNING